MAKHQQHFITYIVVFVRHYDLLSSSECNLFHYFYSAYFIKLILDRCLHYNHSEKNLSLLKIDETFHILYNFNVNIWTENFHGKYVFGYSCLSTNSVLSSHIKLFCLNSDNQRLIVLWCIYTPCFCHFFWLFKKNKSN
jgi:hypothetical protein